VTVNETDQVTKNMTWLQLLWAYCFLLHTPAVTFTKY